MESFRVMFSVDEIIIYRLQVMITSSTLVGSIWAIPLSVRLRLIFFNQLRFLILLLLTKVS